MMNTLKCIECKYSIESCFCSCPYCGEIPENCSCKLESSRENGKKIVIKHHSKQNLSKQSKKLDFVNPKDEDWWRLEKWQIGRCKFP